MKLAIDADPSGYALLDGVLKLLARCEGWPIHTPRLPGPYPDIARHLAMQIHQGHAERAIMICKTGMGSAIVANKVPGVFAGVCRTVADAAELADSRGGNFLCLGTDFCPTEWEALAIIAVWLATPCGHRPNVARLREFDARLHTA